MYIEKNINIYIFFFTINPVLNVLERHVDGRHLLHGYIQMSTIWSTSVDKYRHVSTGIYTYVDMCRQFGRHLSTHVDTCRQLSKDSIP